MIEGEYSKETSILSGIFLFLLISFVAFVAISTLRDNSKPQNGAEVTIRINKLPINVNVARTEEEKKLGMTGKRNIPWNSGELFVFDSEEKWRVLMTGMLFAIDIFWIDADGKIVHIEKDVQPIDGDIVETPIPALYILETRADFADVHNIEVGDIVNF